MTLPRNGIDPALAVNGATTAGPDATELGVVAESAMVTAEHTVLEALTAELTGLFEQVARGGMAGRDEAGRPDPRALWAVAGSAQRVANAAEALTTAALAQAARFDSIVEQRDGTTWAEHALGYLGDFADTDAAAVLGMTTGQAGWRMQRSVAAATRFPTLLHQVGSGEVPMVKLTKVIEVCTDLDTEVCRELDGVLSPVFCEIDPARLTRFTRKCIEALPARPQPDADDRGDAAEDPAAADGADVDGANAPDDVTRRRDTRCSVRVGPAEDGLTELWAVLPSGDAAAVWAAVRSLAAQYRADDPGLDLDTARAQALVALALTDVAVSAEVTLGVPVIRAQPTPDAPRTTSDTRSSRGAGAGTGTGHSTNSEPTDSQWANLEPTNPELTSSESTDPEPTDPEVTNTESIDPEWTDPEATSLEASGVESAIEPGQPDQALPRHSERDPVFGLPVELLGDYAVALTPDGDWVMADGSITPADPTDEWAPPVLVSPMTPIPSSFPDDSSPADAHPPGHTASPDPFLDEPPWPPPEEGDLDVPGVAISGVWIPSIGYVPPADVAAILSGTDLRVGRGLLDAHTGVLLETTTRAYTPTPGIRGFVQTRDGICRVWGCSRPAVQCDLDHAEPYPEGATCPINLHDLCRRHHRAKQRKGFTLELHPDGTATWLAPHGFTRTTQPQHLGDPTLIRRRPG